MCVCGLEEQEKRQKDLLIHKDVKDVLVVPRILCGDCRKYSSHINNSYKTQMTKR
jgi:hypothetical protein